MARPKKQETTAFEEAAQPEYNFNKGAYSFFQNPDTNMWTVVRMTFDQDQLVAAPSVEILAEDREKDLALERFRIYVAKELF